MKSEICIGSIGTYERKSLKDYMIVYRQPHQALTEIYQNRFIRVPIYWEMKHNFPKL